MKISKREKIILGLTVLALVYAGIVFFFSSPENASSGLNLNNSSQELVTDVVQSLARHSRTGTEQIVLEKAQKPWPSDPFITTTMSSLGERESGRMTLIEADSGEFIYTGYVEIGTKRLAIINGEEYETGDRVAGSPLTIRDITMEQVLLGDTGNHIRVVPMVDNSVP